MDVQVQWTPLEYRDECMANTDATIIQTGSMGTKKGQTGEIWSEPADTETRCFRYTAAHSISDKQGLKQNSTFNHVWYPTLVMLAST